MPIRVGLKHCCHVEVAVDTIDARVFDGIEFEISIELEFVFVVDANVLVVGESV